MPSHKSNDYKLTAVQYYLVEDKTQEEVCKIFKCFLRWDLYEKGGINTDRLIEFLEHNITSKLRNKFII